MVKLKASKREIRQGYNYILSVGYCDLQNLLSHEVPFAYSSGMYGWSCDYYEIDWDFCISTGYNPIEKNTKKANYILIRKYEQLAKDCPYYEYDKVKEYKKALLIELMEVVKGYNG